MRKTLLFEAPNARVINIVEGLRAECPELGYKPVPGTEYDTFAPDGTRLVVRVSDSVVSVEVPEGKEDVADRYLADLRETAVKPSPQLRNLPPPTGDPIKPDSEKSLEELQREVLLLQKAQLEHDANRKPVTFGTIVGALLVTWIIVSVVGGIVLSKWIDDMQEEYRRQQIYSSYFSAPESESFLKTLPMAS